MSELAVDTRVTYDDEPDPPTITGVVSTPTEEELEWARQSHDGGAGPEHADVLVDWDDESDPTLSRAWHHPSTLRVLPAE